VATGNCHPKRDESLAQAPHAVHAKLKITYPGTGNSSQFTYDPLGRCVTIKETSNNVVTEQRDFVWCSAERCEVRDGLNGDALVRQFFWYGERISGTSYYFATDHLGSIREMTNGSGTIVWQQSFDPYGVPTTIVNTTPADLGYAGYYLHSRSGLSLTRTRAYSAALGRFISRDPIAESGGVNLYDYVDNEPINLSDPLGLQDQITAPTRTGARITTAPTGGNAGSACCNKGAPTATEPAARMPRLTTGPGGPGAFTPIVLPAVVVVGTAGGAILFLQSDAQATLAASQQRILNQMLLQTASGTEVEPLPEKPTGPGPKEEWGKCNKKCILLGHTPGTPEYLDCMIDCLKCPGE
jgi:RHS repeat-associated protein